MKLLEITSLDVDSPESDAFVQRMQRLRYKNTGDRRKKRERKRNPNAGEWHVRYNDRLSIYELVAERQAVTPASSDSDIVSALSGAIRAAEYKLQWSDDAMDASEEHLSKNQKGWVEEYKDHVAKLS